MSRRALTGGLVVLSLTTASGQQTRQPAAPPTPQPPTFKVEVEYVGVDVRVTDSKGNFVRDLTKEDFQIVEDGRPQTIDAFSLIDIPIDQPVSRSVPIAPDVQSNERPLDGRVYVMILDDASTLFDQSNRTKNAARRFIEQHLGANDLMAIVFTLLNKPAQEFTSDKGLLLAAVDNFMGSEGKDLTLPRLSPGPGLSEPLFTPWNGETPGLTMATLRNVVAWLASQTSRRSAVILVSDGFADGSDIVSRSREKLALENLNSGRLGSANVSIYAVDMRGPGTVQAPLDTLTMITEPNGGFVVMDNNDIGRGFARLVAENSTYYMLGYYASHPRDTKSHSIDVRVKRRGVTVRSRRGYTSRPSDVAAPTSPGDPRASQVTIAALRSPIQRSDLRMRVFAAPFRGPSNPSVLLGIDLVAEGLPLDSDGLVEISYVAVDTKNKEHGWRTDRLSLNLQPDTRTRVERNGMSVLKRMELPPGRYRLHVAATAPDRNLAGSVLYDLEVPDFDKAGLAMSGVLLTSESRADTLIAHADEQARSALLGPPTATRTFPRNDEIAVFAEVYATNQAPSDEVDIVTSVRSDAGALVFEKTQTLESSELEGGYRHVVGIPLQPFEPGAFILSVEATSKRKPNSAKTVRHVPFRVTAADLAR